MFITNPCGWAAKLELQKRLTKRSTLSRVWGHPCHPSFGWSFSLSHPDCRPGTCTAAEVSCSRIHGELPDSSHAMRTTGLIWQRIAFDSNCQVRSGAQRSLSGPLSPLWTNCIQCRDWSSQRKKWKYHSPVKAVTGPGNRMVKLAMWCDCGGTRLDY